ncbi:MAG: response regulator [SAR202 cluster bacterium]|jgi:putative two-component system response regulator|nr:response regulator [SAR202 cluster bacterium]MDP6512597.1 response regulator [SAR202 cluster bacterium]
MLRPKPLILCVDDESDICEMLRDFLEDPELYQVITCSETNLVLPLVQRESPDLVTLDMRMPGKSGLELLEEIKTYDNDIAVIMVTAVREVETALQAVRLGAYDYVNKPLGIEEVNFAVNKALEHRRLVLENRNYQLNLERMVEEKTSHLDQKVRELSALNSLFQTHLNQRYDAEKNNAHIHNRLISLANDLQDLIVETSSATPQTEEISRSDIAQITKTSTYTPPSNTRVAGGPTA